MLKESLGLHGKIISVSDERGLDGIPNGVSRVRMEIKDISLFPHMLWCWFGGKTFTGLITVPVRAPMCLRCREVGHVRGMCPLNRPVGRKEEDLVVDDPPPVRPVTRVVAAGPVVPAPVAPVVPKVLAPAPAPAPDPGPVPGSAPVAQLTVAGGRWWERPSLFQAETWTLLP